MCPDTESKTEGEAGALWYERQKETEEPWCEPQASLPRSAKARGAEERRGGLSKAPKARTHWRWRKEGLAQILLVLF